MRRRCAHGNHVLSCFRHCGGDPRCALPEPIVPPAHHLSTPARPGCSVPLLPPLIRLAFVSWQPVDIGPVSRVGVEDDPLSRRPCASDRTRLVLARGYPPRGGERPLALKGRCARIVLVVLLAAKAGGAPLPQLLVPQLPVPVVSPAVHRAIRLDAAGVQPSCADVAPPVVLIETEDALVTRRAVRWLTPPRRHVGLAVLVHPPAEDLPRRIIRIQRVHFPHSLPPFGVEVSLDRARVEAPARHRMPVERVCRMVRRQDEVLRR
mmetsp:Transcript_39866/g.94546  ORF Transcript_39866/g.94546 Transcript_39866/m.94546 type:complete len:264 (-) Transcript_39866:199-990(-)